MSVRSKQSNVIAPAIEDHIHFNDFEDSQDETSHDRTPIARPMTAFRRRKQEFTRIEKKFVSYLNNIFNVGQVHDWICIYVCPDEKGCTKED